MGATDKLGFGGRGNVKRKNCLKNQRISQKKITRYLYTGLKKKEYAGLSYKRKRKTRNMLAAKNLTMQDECTWFQVQGK